MTATTRLRPRLAALLCIGALSACAPPAPRPLPVPGGTGTSARLLPLETEIRAIIATEAPADSLEVAVALFDLATGDSLLIDAHTAMHAASTMKVPVMLELFRRAEAGDLDIDAEIPVRNEFTSIADGSTYSLSPGDDSDAELYEHIGGTMTISELMRRMITRSSNLATNILIELADPARIEATLAELGASEMRVLRGVEDIPAYERGLNNTTTAYGFAKVMQGVAAGRIVSSGSTDRIVEILEAQEFRDKIPAGLPEGTRVGNKTGWITAIDHDGAIIFPEGRDPYALVILTRGFGDRDLVQRVARRISRRAWLYLIEGS